MVFDYIAVALGFGCIVVAIFERNYSFGGKPNWNVVPKKAPLWLGRAAFMLLAGLFLAGGFLDLFLGHSR